MARKRNREYRQLDRYTKREDWDEFSEQEFQEKVEKHLAEQAAQAATPARVFEPTVTSTFHEKKWIKDSLGKFFQDHWFDDVLYRIKPGKEATVYCCQANPGTGLRYLAAKVYRPRMFRAMRNDALYKIGRGLLHSDGKQVLDSRSLRAVRDKTRHGRRIDMYSWCQYEYHILEQLHAAGADVPRPLAHDTQAILMEYIGDVPQAAPTLHEVSLPRPEARRLFDRCLRNIELFLAQNIIHADLSAYNVLYWQGQIKIIDLPQAVDPQLHPEALPLLSRDVRRICEYFQRQGVTCDSATITHDLWERFVKGQL